MTQALLVNRMRQHGESARVAAASQSVSTRTAYATCIELMGATEQTSPSTPADKATARLIPALG